MSPAYRRRIERFRYARRKLDDAQALRIYEMRERGMTWPAIARWFSNNVTPISWQTARREYEKGKA